MLFVAKELDWVNQTEVELSILRGEFLFKSRSTIRLALACCAAVILASLFGIVTWPRREQAPRPIQVPIPNIATDVSSKKPPILPLTKTPQPVVPLVGKPPKQSPKPKAKAQTALYPIISVTNTQVTHNADTHQLSITIGIANSTATEANAHITINVTGDENGTEVPVAQDQTGEPRDIGLGPPPFVYQLTKSTGLTPEGEIAYTAGTLTFKVLVTVSYPDRGGHTVYHFDGATRPNLDHLDFTGSGWDQERKH